MSHLENEILLRISHLDGERQSDVLSYIRNIDGGRQHSMKRYKRKALRQIRQALKDDWFNPHLGQ